MIASLILGLQSLAASGLQLAQENTLVVEDPNGIGVLIRHLIAATVFSAVGIVVLAASVWIISKVTPFSMTKEIEEDENVALGIVVGSIIIGMSMIISAAILG